MATNDELLDNTFRYHEEEEKVQIWYKLY